MKATSHPTEVNHAQSFSVCMYVQLQGKGYTLETTSSARWINRCDVATWRCKDSSTQE